jgi:hypothetical protein
MPEARIHVYASNAEGSNAYEYEDIVVRYWNFHTPYPGYGLQTLHLADMHTNNGGRAFFRLPEDDYQVQLMAFQNVMPGIDDQGLLAPDGNADLSACAGHAYLSEVAYSDVGVTTGTSVGNVVFGTGETTFGCNGFESENIPTLENIFSFDMPAEEDIDGFYAIEKQANRLNFNVTLEDEGYPNTTMLDDVNIRVFATTEDGLPDLRGEFAYTNGQLADLSYVRSEDEPLERNFTSAVEVFEGFYRVIVTAHAHRCTDDDDTTSADATPCTSSAPYEIDVHPYISDVIVSTGDGSMIYETAALNDDANDNEITLTLMDATDEGDPAVADDGVEVPIVGREVRVYDCQTGWFVNSAVSEADGDTPVPVGNFTTLVAVSDLSPYLADGATEDPVVASGLFTVPGTGGYAIDVSADPTKTIKEKLLRGRVGPAASIQDMPATQVMMVQDFGDCVNPADSTIGFVGRWIYPRTTTPSQGYFDDRTDGDDGDEIRVWGAALEGTVDGLHYNMSVNNLQDDYFLLTPVLEVVSDADEQEKNITVKTGGFLEGKVTRLPGNNNMPDIYITAISDEGLGTNIDYTDETGDYHMPLPAGAYTVWVGDTPFTPAEIDHISKHGYSRTDSVVIEEDETTVLNFVYGSHSGRVENTEGVEVDEGTLPGSGEADPTDSGGNYTYEFWTGINWVCANPKTSDDGDNLEFQCFYEMTVEEDDFQ